MCVQISTDKSSSCQHELHGHLFREPGTQEQDTEMAGLPRFSLKGLTLTWPEPCSDIWVAGLQSQAMEGDSNRSKPRCSLPSQSREVNGVAGNCGDRGMEQKLLAGIWLERTGGTLSSSNWRRQKLSRRAEFSRHCLTIYSNFLDALVCAAWLTQTY